MWSKFHTAIKVVRETSNIVDAFSILVYGPVNFVFDKYGTRLFGDDPRECIDNGCLAGIPLRRS